VSSDDVRLDTKWVITLISGDVMSVYADESRIVGEYRIFEVGVGMPPKLVTIARVPSALIRNCVGQVNDGSELPAQ
jgi:hypothetical protein